MRLKSSFDREGRSEGERGTCCGPPGRSNLEYHHVGHRRPNSTGRLGVCPRASTGTFMARRQFERPDPLSFSPSTRRAASFTPIIRALTGPITGVDGISEILPLWLSGIVFRPKASPVFVNIYGSKRYSSDDRNEPLEPSSSRQGPALVANSMCTGREEHTMSEVEVQIGNSC